MIKKTAVVDGATYETAPEKDFAICQGCVGWRNEHLCLSLPRGCSDGKFIWITQAAIAAHGKDEQAGDFQGSGLIKQAVLA